MIAVSPQEDSARAAAPGSRVYLRLAGMTIELEGIDLELKVNGMMNGFLVPPERPDVTIKVKYGELNDGRDGQFLFDSGSHWQLYRVGEDYQFRLALPAKSWQPYKLARFNRDFTQGEILCSRERYAEGEPLYPLEYPLDEVLFVHLLALNGRGVELHSCGLVDETGRGYLFIGHSEAGKTTTARLWEKRAGVKILSDDRIILRREGSEFFMYGTPWHGEAELAYPDKARLDHLFILGRGPEHKLVAIGQGQAAAEIFARSFTPFHSAEGLAFTLAFLSDLTESVPCHELQFVPDESVVDFIRQL
jgi:hypothetical protein